MRARYTGRKLTTLIGCAALCLLLPCFLLISVAAWKLTVAERDRLASHNAAAAEAALAHVDRYLGSVIGMLQVLATSPALDAGDFARFDAQARDLLDLQGVHTVVRDLNGEQWVNTRLPWGSVLPRGAPAIDKIVAEHHDPYVSDVIVGPAVGKPLVVVTVPVRRNGKAIYFLGAGISPDVFSRILAQAGIQSPNMAVIADRHGLIVARSDRHDELVGKPMPAFAEHAGERGQWAGISANGTEIVSTYRRSDLAGWLVAVGVERAVLDGPLRRALWLLSGLGVLLVVAGVVVSTMIARRVLAAHSYLADVAGQLERQKGSRADAIAVGTTGIAEVDDLGRVLANTSSRLLVQAEQLERANHELEARIRSRTGALEESRHLLRTTLRQMDQGLVLLDQEHTVRLCNPRANELLHLPENVLRENAAFRDIRAFQNARGDFSLVPAATSQKITGSDTRLFPLVYDWPRPDGTTLEVRRVQMPDGSSVNTFTDVTERRGAEAAVRESERLYRLLAENVTDLVTWARFDATLLYVSPSAIDVLGYAPDELVGQSATELLHPDDVEEVQQVLGDIQAGLLAEQTLRLRYRRKDDSLVWTEAAFSVTRDDDTGEPNGYIASLRDVTERQHAEARANHLARHDLLTRLPNRILFHETLQTKLEDVRQSGGTCALFYGDLDRFKTVNDTLGHAVGDAVLKVVAKRLRSTLGPNALIARFGGDEFVILLTGPEAEEGAAELLAQEVIDAVSAPIALESRNVSVGMSLGISYAPRDGLIGDALLRSADLALFQAKAEGADTFRVFEPAMSTVTEEKQRLELDLRQALAHDEFELHYQPIIDLAAGCVSGAEALLRWRHPQRGLVSPIAFIPVAEQLGLIDQIGAWALRTACREASSWPDSMRVAVNVSAVQFQQAGLIDAVMHALRASGLSATRLELEITETALMQDGSRVAETMDRLRALGVRTALDDFGTGYSSLSYLRKFHFDKLKIDRSFVADLAHPDMQRIVQAIMALGHGLNMTITAEGVEAEEQLEIVRGKGCNEVQGYYFSRPLPAADFHAFIGTCAVEDMKVA